MRRLLAVLTTATLVACGGEATPTAIACRAPAGGALQARLSAHLAAEAGDGFRGAVAIGDGTAEPFVSAHGEDATATHPLGTLSHPILAAGVLRLVEDGVLTPRTPVAGLVPGLPAAWEGKTVDDLLVRDDGYAIVPRLIEAAAGVPADSFVRTRIFVPARMDGAVVTRDGAMRAPALDLYRFLGALRPGRLLKAETLSLMMQPHGADARDSSANDGYGLELRFRDGQLRDYYKVADDENGANGLFGVVGNETFVVLSSSGTVGGMTWSHRINQGIQACLGRGD